MYKNGTNIVTMFIVTVFLLILSGCAKTNITDEGIAANNNTVTEYHSEIIAIPNNIGMAKKYARQIISFMFSVMVQQKILLQGWILRRINGRGLKDSIHILRL